MQQDHKQFRGTGVALVTPFRGGQVDFPALGKLIRHCLDGGVDFLVSLGTTGEVPTLSRKERLAVLDFTICENNGRLPLVAGFGGNNTQAIIDSMKSHSFEGVDAILSASPSYNKPTQEGIFQHYMALAEQAPRPIIIYNVPGRTGSNVEADTTLRLAHASGKFLGIKEASPDLNQATRILKHRPKGFLVLSGDDPLALPLVALGGDGVISVIANALPGLFPKMIQYGLQGEMNQAAGIHLRLADIHPLLYEEGNPAGIKAALEMLGICLPDTRLPLTPLSVALRQRLRDELVEANIIVPDDAIV